MAFMMFSTLLSADAGTGHFIGDLLLKLHEGVMGVGGNFGWTVIIFTIILRLILSPLDIWQKVSMRKQMKKMEKLRPKMEKLQKQYANRPDILKQKQYELQRSSNINMLASCLPMIVTMVVFFVVFAGFRALVSYENQQILLRLNDIYAQNYGKIPDEQLAVLLREGYQPESWLWVKNVFMSDIGTNVIPTIDQLSGTGFSSVGMKDFPSGLLANYETLVGPAMDFYNKSGTWDFAKWNGYFVLPLLAFGTSVLSTWLMQKTNPQTAAPAASAEQQKSQKMTMKIMNFVMPMMLAFFAIMYSAAFAIYYVMSNILSTLLTLGFNVIGKQIDKKNENKPEILGKSKA